MWWYHSVIFTCTWHVEINLEIKLRTKESLLSTWNKLVLSKQQITSSIKNLSLVLIYVWSHNNNNFLVFCDACKYWYDPTCMLVNAKFNSSFLLDFFVCSCCIFRKFRSFFRYLHVSSVTLIDGIKEKLKHKKMP